MGSLFFQLFSGQLFYQGNENKLRCINGITALVLLNFLIFILVEQVIAVI